MYWETPLFALGVLFQSDIVYKEVYTLSAVSERRFFSVKILEGHRLSLWPTRSDMMATVLTVRITHFPCAFDQLYGTGEPCYL